MIELDCMAAERDYWRDKYKAACKEIVELRRTEWLEIKKDKRIAELEARLNMPFNKEKQKRDQEEIQRRDDIIEQLESKLNKKWWQIWN